MACPEARGCPWIYTLRQGTKCNYIMVSGYDENTDDGTGSGSNRTVWFYTKLRVSTFIQERCCEDTELCLRGAILVKEIHDERSSLKRISKYELGRHIVRCATSESRNVVLRWRLTALDSDKRVSGLLNPSQMPLTIVFDISSPGPDSPKSQFEPANLRGCLYEIHPPPPSFLFLLFYRGTTTSLRYRLLSLLPQHLKRLLKTILIQQPWPKPPWRQDSCRYTLLLSCAPDLASINMTNNITLKICD
jgi:hypothetical protein